jgi:hypothetical protein
LLGLGAVPAAGSFVMCLAQQGPTATVSVDAGGVAVRYADSLRFTATTLTPTLRIAWPRATVDATGTYAYGGSDGWSAQGQLAGSVFTPALGIVRGEFAGSAGGSTHQDGTRTGELLARGRAHAWRGAWGAWLGGGGGRTWDGATWRGVVVGDIGLWHRVGEASGLLTVTPTVVDDTIRYTDTELAVRWSRSRVELSGTLGARAGHGLPITGGRTHAWGSLSARTWVATHLAVALSAGNYPVDFTQGYPGGRYILAGLHVSARAFGARDDARTTGRAHGSAPQPSRDVISITEFALATTSGATRTIRVRAPRATRVEIAGDFTDWAPVALTSAGNGWWTVTLSIAPGTHQIDVRLDGTTWVVPPGLVPITDESGTVGLLIVPK